MSQDPDVSDVLRIMVSTDNHLVSAHHVPGCLRHVVSTNACEDLYKAVIITRTNDRASSRTLIDSDSSFDMNTNLSTCSHL